MISRVSNLILLAGLSAALASGPLRIGYFWGAEEYDSEASLKWLAKTMEESRGSRSFFFRGVDTDSDVSEATATVIPNLHELDSLDVLVIFARRVWLNQAQLARMKAFLNSGKGIVGIRSACHAFQSWEKGFGIDSVILGGAYNNHGPKTGYDLEFTAAAETSPLFAGVKPWRAGSGLYYQNLRGRSVAADCTILMYGKEGSARHPVAWTRVRMGSNIFNTSAGVQSDFRNIHFQKLIVNATLWAGKALVPTGLAAQAGKPSRLSGPSRSGRVPGYLPDGRKVDRHPVDRPAWIGYPE